MQVKQLTLQRLMKQQANIERQPVPNALVAREDILKWYFCLYNLEGDYSGGFYFGLLQLHQNYPFAAPKLFFYTPSGRFDINLPICTSFTNYHQESWTSAWNVRTLILATISFMYSEEPSYGCCQAPKEERQRLARDSLAYNLRNPTFVRLFEEKLIKLKLIEERTLPNHVSSVPYSQLQQREKEDMHEARDQKADEFEELKGLQQKQNKREKAKSFLKLLAFVGTVAGVTVLAANYL